MGLPMSEVLFNLAGGFSAGKKVKAFAPSGPLGLFAGIIRRVRIWISSRLPRRVPCSDSGAIVVCAEGRCMLDMALNAVMFFRNESCGKCVPCRMGSQKLVDILDRVDARQRHRVPTCELMDELTETMKLTSICGLGQFAHGRYLRHSAFPRRNRGALYERRCPAGVCPMRGDAEFMSGKHERRS